MSEFKLAFCVRDQKYADIIDGYLKNLDLNGIEVFFISEENISCNFNNLVIKNYIDYENNEVLMLNENIWKNKNIYKADPRCINGDKKIDQDFQNLYIKACRKIFNQHAFDLIFSGAAGRMIWTIPHLVALENNLLAYKIQQMDYLNPKFEGVRLWFCTDIFWDIDLNVKYSFEWNKNDIDLQINDLKKSLIEENFNLASRALKSRENYTPKKINNILKAIIKVAFKNDYLSKLKLISLINSKRNKGLYKNPNTLKEKYIIYPLNQPHDEQLLVRAPKYLDTISNIKFIADNLPSNINLLVKEHPVNPGMISQKEIKKIINDYKNVYFVNPELPIRPLILQSQGLVTINSTAGIEALICDKKIVVLGESYYKHNSMAIKPKDKSELKNALLELVDNKNFETEATTQMLSTLLNQSYPEPNTYPSKLSDTNLVVGEAIRYKIKQVMKLKNFK